MSFPVSKENAKIHYLVVCGVFHSFYILLIFYERSNGSGTLLWRILNVWLLCVFMWEFTVKINWKIAGKCLLNWGSFLFFCTKFCLSENFHGFCKNICGFSIQYIQKITISYYSFISLVTNSPKSTLFRNKIANFSSNPNQFEFISNSTKDYFQ